MKKNRDWQNKLAEMARDTDLEIVEIALQKENAGRFLRIFIDKEGGVTLEDCERFHRSIIPVVEHVDYDYLEVCSPGADRPLKNDRDFEKNRGKQIEVKLFTPQDGKKQFTGELVSYDTEGFAIGTAEGEKHFSRKEVAIARPVIDVEARLDAMTEEEG